MRRTLFGLLAFVITFVPPAAQAKHLDLRLPDGEYGLAVLDRQFPYQHDPLSPSSGPYLTHVLKIDRGRFALRTYNTGSGSWFADVVTSGTLSTRIDAEGRMSSYGIVEEKGTLAAHAKDPLYTPPKTTDYAEALEIRFNRSSLRDRLTYRPWNVRAFREGTLTLHQASGDHPLRTNRRLQIVPRPIGKTSFASDEHTRTKIAPPSR